MAFDNINIINSIYIGVSMVYMVVGIIHIAISIKKDIKKFKRHASFITGDRLGGG